MKEDKSYTEGISTKNSRFLSWLDNFWYHYKWPTIAIAFVVVVLGVCTGNYLINNVGKGQNVIFTYAGPKEFVTAPAEKLSVNSALSEYSKSVYGEKATASLQNFLIYSEEQIKEIESEVDEKGNQKYKVDTAFNTSEMNGFHEYSQTGASFILLLDPTVYQTLLNQSGESERLVELSVVYGSTPEGANDKYSVRLGDTEAYKNTPELQVLPEDTIVCLHARLILSTNKSEYDYHVSIFKSFATLVPIESESATD